MNKETWKSISGTRGRYLVSNLGRFKSFHPRWKGPRILSLGMKGKYPGIDIYYGKNIRESRHAHRVVWETFFGPIPSGTQINHIDGNKENYSLGNLECVSASENCLHAYKNKLKIPSVGSKWHASKLNEKKVSRIKRLLKRGHSQQKLASLHGVNQCTISDISNGVTWRHVRAE